MTFQGYKYIHIDVIKNSILHVTDLTKKGIGDYSAKIQDIQVFQKCNKKCTSKNPCYQNSICVSKHVNFQKSGKGKNGQF